MGQLGTLLVKIVGKADKWDVDSTVWSLPFQYVAAYANYQHADPVAIEFVFKFEALAPLSKDKTICYRYC